MRQKNWVVIIPSCIYFLIIFLTLIYTILGDLSTLIGKEIPSWYNYFIYMTSIMYFVGFIFIIKMKKVALISLTALTVILHIFSFIMGIYSFFSLGTDIIIFGLIWTQFKRME